MALFVSAACREKAVGAAEPAPVDYGRDVQPILAANCFSCHGPDAKKREAELRLDTFAGATAAGAIVPGNSGESELVRRILSDNVEEAMPPAKSNLRLTDAQKDLLRRWIDQGAPYARHWAFVAPVRPSVPAAPAGATVRNPIDAFIAARLQQEGLAQAPEADKGRLLRRVSLDLTGLPPTLEELDAFLADVTPEAYEQAVDRLLASPRYGERMVWDWLDAARYADTNGYQGDPTRPMWYWRDWAIEAFNQNLPFDRFTVEQLAGDLLPDPTQSQLVATGFHRNHMINGEGGRIAEESRIEYVQDRVETTGAVWMGLTLTCCRCHDHKYDPFTQQEYYRLAAYFNSIDETGANDAGGLANPVISLATPDQKRHLETLRETERLANDRREALERELAPGQADWERAVAAAKWSPLTIGDPTSEQGATFSRLDDGSVRAAGTLPETDEYVVALPQLPADAAGFRLEALPDETLPAQGPGRANNGNFVLSEVGLAVGDQTVALRPVQADFAQEGWPATGAFDADASTGWAVAPQFGKAHELTFAPSQPLNAVADRAVAMRLSFRHGARHTLGRFRLSVTTDSPALLRPALDGVRAILAKAPESRTDAEKQELARAYRETSPQLAAAVQDRDAAGKAREDFERSLPRTMVMRERAQSRETFVLVKGAYNVPADKVEHGVLAELAPLPPDAAKNRLALANWLTSPEHPLTARVTVNRLWQQVFGVGLVKTAEDFGVQGDKPSHPDLLDWLAVDFRESGWDVKRLLRTMVTSATYRQSSRTPPGMAERDPENRLLARGPRSRMPSWMLRDQALAIGGLLAGPVGGPPVKGYQPAGVWEDATFGQIRYEQDRGEALYRRSLYIFWRRIVAPTVFFDVANRQNCTVKNSRTNTPLHALVTMNETTYVESARALAQRTRLSMAPDDAARLAEMFRRCTARNPRPAESERLLKRLALLRATYAADPAAAQKLLAVGESPVDASLEPAELAAWTGVAALLSNLDETLCKE